ncbi:MAG: hypothetical protein KKC68_02550 [Candidatus Thermoplasmatota archaeon]|nr:hypothetical protein [Candidatus Thermoplasmatota archaeon]MBU1940632.1 hypothetical protein [Candidatus Thermoplasmatota archaeon]
MYKYLKISSYGIFIWLIPFILSFIIFPIRDNNRILFESLMPLILTIVVMLFTILYFTKPATTFLKDGLILAIIWISISIILDLIMFLPETTWQMSISDYFMDIGITYLIIGIIPLGIGYLLEKK